MVLIKEEYLFLKNNEKYWNYLKNFTPNKQEGFIWTSDETIKNMMTELDTLTNRHSGATLAIAMRELKHLADAEALLENILSVSNDIVNQE